MTNWRTRLPGWFTPTPHEAIGVAVVLLGAVVYSLWFWTNQQAPVVIKPVVAAPLDTYTDLPPSHELTITVYVSGAVTQPGLATVHEGARVADAVTQRGGISQDADVDRLNMARLVYDGEQIHVPRHGEADPVASQSTPPSNETPLNLNAADVIALTQLPGIGPAKAEAIVSYRETHGPFADPGQLRNVTGIGEATFQRLAPLVTVR